ncbi:MAG: O-methyltransferase [Lachnospiraceae bacterium]|nr:O-methyltransferase [Lachnospiraceae bacterium]MDE6253744.1 O-methyltransferase [Lachnospiraceae bacterium]
MIVDERIIKFLHSLEGSNGELCDNIEEYARKNYVPIIRKEMESFLKVMVCIKKPKRILELGTAIGYSAIMMSQVMPDNCHITTIENYDKRIPIALENIKKAGMEERITLIEGDALSVIPDINETFDFVFMDAAKGQYMNYLELIIDKIDNGGVIISDNVLQEGDIVKSRFGVERRNRTIHSRMREYLYTIKNIPELETSIVPIGDGITVSVKKGIK